MLHSSILSATTPKYLKKMLHVDVRNVQTIQTNCSLIQCSNLDRNSVNFNKTCTTNSF